LRDDLYFEIELIDRISPILSSWIKLKDFLNRDAEDIENGMARIEEKLETSELSPREANLLSNLLQNYDWALEQHADYANLLRRSFVVSACSFLESTLIEACFPNEENEVENYYEELLHMGNRIQKLLKRLFPGEKRGEIIGEKRWNFLCDIVKVRNFIVHANGNQALVHKNPTPEHLENLVRKEPGLDWVNTAYTTEIVVHEEYCDEVTDLLSFLVPTILAQQ
jgi:hypothetical protein